MNLASLGSVLAVVVLVLALVFGALHLLTPIVAGLLALLAVCRLV